jgi:tagaturonate epimerase
VHSGSDKFSIYSIINRLIKKHDSGLHVKTAGTTWLEEVIGLAESDGEGLALVKEVYAQAHEHFEELSAPYSTVIDIDPGKLPDPKSVIGWSATQYADALRHVESSSHYNPHFGSCCTSVLRSPPEWASGLPTLWKPTKRSWAGTSRETFLTAICNQSSHEPAWRKCRRGQATTFDHVCLT